MEDREHTFSPSTPPLPNSYMKSRGDFLREKGAATTTLRNILFLYVIFEAAEISSYWKNREGYVKGEKRRNGTYLAKTPMAFLS